MRAETERARDRSHAGTTAHAVAIMGVYIIILAALMYPIARAAGY